MQVSLIDIGTSRGIRIPASVLKEFDSSVSFELKVVDHKIVLDAVNNPRNGWDEKFNNSQNDLLIDDVLDIKDWNEL